ncbi:porin [Bradyrhizobium retamae]|uniref:porin n=1 Tax=Bradyrhizobium retamae TaxID=1300035 RepID=UPI0012E3670A|nr:porin [Bradyrhizobium retamae]
MRTYVGVSVLKKSVGPISTRDESNLARQRPSDRLMVSRWIVTGALVGCAISYSPSVGHAESSDDLRQELKRLQARVHSLEANEQTGARADRAAAKAARLAQKEAEEARARAEEARVQAEAARAKAQAAQKGADPLQGSFPGSMRIPGTDTSFKLYGHAKLNVYGDLGPRNRSDTVTVPSIPLSRGALAARTPGDVAVSGRYSRLGLDVRTPISEGFGTVRNVLEVDFAGQLSDPTTQAIASSYTTRLRLAFAEFGKTDGWGSIIAGQAWSLYDDATLNPLRSVSDWSTPATTIVRQGAIQYSKSIGSTTFSVGLENTYSDVTSTVGTGYPDSNGGAGFTLSGVPDLTARALWRGESGSFALRGMMRNIEINNGAGRLTQRYDASTLGYGIGASGSLYLLDGRLALFATANYGPGIGRYLSMVSPGFGAVTNFGLPGVTAQTATIDTVTAMAGVVGVQYKFLPNLQSNAFVAAGNLNYPDYVNQFTTTSSAINRSLWAASVNLIYSPVPSIDLGIEYLHGSRNLLVPDGNGVVGGTADRIQSMVLVRF